VPASAYVPTELFPAWATTAWPFGAKTSAKGTGADDAFTTGAADSQPFQLTPKTSMALVLAFVVTRSCEPSGENATWPGELR